MAQAAMLTKTIKVYFISPKVVTSQQPKRVLFLISVTCQSGNISSEIEPTKYGILMVQDLLTKMIKLGDLNPWPIF